MQRIDGITITFNRTGESGNIFWITKTLLHEYRQRGVSLEDFKPVFDRITACHSYDDALDVIREFATLIDEEHMTWEEYFAICKERWDKTNRSDREAIRAYNEWRRELRRKVCEYELNRS